MSDDFQGFVYNKKVSGI